MCHTQVLEARVARADSVLTALRAQFKPILMKLDAMKAVNCLRCVSSAGEGLIVRFCY